MKEIDYIFSLIDHKDFYVLCISDKKVYHEIREYTCCRDDFHYTFKGSGRSWSDEVHQVLHKSVYKYKSWVSEPKHYNDSLAIFQIGRDKIPKEEYEIINELEEAKILLLAEYINQNKKENQRNSFEFIKKTIGVE